jgi:hypothetical protein
MDHSQHQDGAVLIEDVEHHPVVTDAQSVERIARSAIVFTVLPLTGPGSAMSRASFSSASRTLVTTSGGDFLSALTADGATSTR